MRLRAVILSLLFALAACSPMVQSPTPAAAFPAALSFENRGGPAFTVQIGAAVIATVACNSGTTLTPGQAGVPVLPWDLKVIRVRDGNVLVDLRVTELPRWFVQIGGDAGGGGLSAFPVAGPAGPSCPPAP
jgi:hypothetical protein